MLAKLPYQSLTKPNLITYALIILLTRWMSYLLLMSNPSCHHLQGFSQWQKWTEKRKGQCHYQGFKEGDLVWLEGTNLKSIYPCIKLTTRRWEPFPITKALPSGIDFQLELPPQWKIHLVFHASLLMPYKETEEHGHNFEQLPPELIEGELEYEVEQVLASRRTGHKRKMLEYLLKWKGYSQVHNS